MKCRNCGTEFAEGIFCPECGFKNEMETKPVLEEETIKEKVRLAEKEKELQKKERELKEQLKRETMKLEEQRKRQEKIIENERLKMAENVRLQEEKQEKEKRTVRGRLYNSEGDAEKAREEHGKIDALLNRLSATKSQKERQKILSEFRDEIITVDAKNRMELLKEKVNRKKPKDSMMNWIYGGTIILAILGTVIVGNAGYIESALGTFLIIWYGLGFLIWPIWRIVLFIKSKTKNYYLNLKNL